MNRATLAGETDLALKLFRDIQDKNLEPEILTFTEVIRALIKKGEKKWHKFKEYFEKMSNVEVVPDHIFFLRFRGSGNLRISKSR